MQTVDSEETADSEDGAGHQPTRADSAAQPGSLREVVAMAWPIVISMLSYTAMGVVDTLLVGWLGTTEVAAVGLATTAIFMLSAFGLGLLQSVKIVVSQATGAGEHARAEAASWQGVWLALPLGLLLMASGLGAATLFEWLGGSEALRHQAAAYFTLRVGAGPLWLLLVVLSSAIQGTGDTRTPMVINLVVNGLNIALDLVLIFGLGPVPALGVEGAAWATAAAQAIGATLILAVFVARARSRPHVDVALMGEVLRLGVPVGVQFMLDVACWVVFGAALARLGEAELAAHQIAIKILSVSFLPGHGIGEAACVLVGRYVGAEDPVAARRVVIEATKVGVVAMGSLGVVFWAIPEALFTLFQASPEVVGVGAQLLTIAALFQVADAVAVVALGALKGQGETRFVMWLSISSSWLVLLPIGMGLGVGLGMGAVGVWIGLLVHITLIAVVSTARLSRLPAAPLVPASTPLSTASA